MTFAEKVIRFNESLQLNLKLPKGVEVMNPFMDKDVKVLARKFYEKFYDDSRSRKLILGINPGRLGAGVTGIPFTDPVKLEQQCGIKNELKKVTEPTAGFVYDVISALGGTASFYSNYFINSVSPLGFVKDGKNYNYYDSRELENILEPFIVESINAIIDLGIKTDTCYCLGNGKNFKFLEHLNKQHDFFGKVIPLPHPRWVVQYRRKEYDKYIGHFQELLG